MAAFETPELIIRLGTHAEKEYLEKIVRKLDGFMIAANLLEATPGATTSLLVKLGGKKIGASYYLDPMTYGYGLDLDYLKSEQKIKKKKVFTFKRSYTQLAEQLGGVFYNAVKKDRVITPADFDDASLRETCQSVANYQLSRPGTEWAQDEVFSSYSHDIPNPTAVLTPYFFALEDDFDDWLELIVRFAEATVKLKLEQPVHSVVCADESFLDDEESVNWLAEELPKTGVNGVWLWFSNLNEHSARTEQLATLKELVATLSESMSVYNMHGGYFSLLLSKFGMRGAAHGIGYGEQKDVAPVQGQSTPTVRYYLPDVRKRLGVPDIERTFTKLKITTSKDFFKKICGCVICKGVLKQGLQAFSEFGEMHYANLESKRRSQTATAAKLCRYHFLMNRLGERDSLRRRSISEIVDSLDQAWSIWSKQPTIANDADHLVRWRKAIRE